MKSKESNEGGSSLLLSLLFHFLARVAVWIDMLHYYPQTT
jgi:hypothetical protein